MKSSKVFPGREIGQIACSNWTGTSAPLLDLLDELNVTDNIMAVFAGDNGPEEVLTWRGTPGYWEGS